MAFLTRWDEDTSRPSFTSALRDAAVRAVLPALPLFLVLLGFGLLLMGPLRTFANDENSVNRWFVSERSGTGNAVTHVMSMIGNTEYVIAVAVLVAAVVAWRTRQWWFAVVPLLAIALQATVFVIVTAIVGRPRPTVQMLDPAPPTSSYPSGHVGASTALYVTFALMATRIRHVVLRRVVVTLCVVVPFVVAFARLYRGAHHVTDVLWGAVNGLVCALLAWHYLRRGREDGGASSEAADTPATDAGQSRA